MKKLLSIVGILFSLFILIAMIKLFNYNVENTHMLFALFMTLIPSIAFVGGCYHFYLNYIKK